MIKNNKRLKPFTKEDLKKAITIEIEELVREEKEKILHRAKQRLAGKFGK